MSEFPSQPMTATELDRIRTEGPAVGLTPAEMQQALTQQQTSPETDGCCCASHQQPKCSHWRMGRCSDKSPSKFEEWPKETGQTGATDIVYAAACLIWAELCPGLVMGDDDRPHYENAAKAVLSLSSTTRGGENG